MKDYIVGLGEILFDCLPDGKKLGGAPANFAYHVSQFGLNGIAVSAIGDDEDGRLIREKLKARSLQTHLEVVDYPTGTVQVTLSGNGIPQYDICHGVAYDNIPWTPQIEEIALNARAVCFGSLAQRSAVSRATIHRFLDTMPKLGSFKVFDINLRQNWYSVDVIEESLKRCNVLKINDEELDVVATMLLGETTESGHLIAEDADRTRHICRELIARYDLKMLILTCGAIGSYVFTADSESYVATPKVQVADTVGAGDSFTATFVAQILLGKFIREAHEKAVRVSAYVCTRHGATPVLPDELK